MKLLRLFTTILATVTAFTRLSADSIAIADPSFEALTGSDPAFFDSAGKLRPYQGSIGVGAPHGSNAFNSADPIPGWETGSSAGIINYTGTPFFPNGVPDGQNVAWINVSGTISQTLTTTYQPNISYELDVSVGRLVGFDSTGYQISLYAGAQLLATDNNSISLTPGAFSTATVATIVPANSPAVGQPIEIVLQAKGLGNSAAQVVFDNVQLKATAVPEPSTLALAALGFAGLVFASRRFRR